MGLRRFFLTHKRSSVVSGLGALLVLLSFQQCAKVKLTDYQEISFLSTGVNPYRLDPPTDYSAPRRYIFLVDMSNSMISGPCYNDVNGGQGGWNTATSYEPFDPNLGRGRMSDHRATGMDCLVDPSATMVSSHLPTTLAEYSQGNIFKTFNGLDYEGKRFTVLENWLGGVADDMDVKVMLIPVSGGQKGQKLIEELISRMDDSSYNSIFKYISKQKALDVVGHLRDIQEENYELVTDEENILRYNETIMGVSSPGSYLREIYKPTLDEMNALNYQGKLSYAEIEFVHISDGMLVPIQKHINEVFRIFAQCSAVTVANPPTSGVCSDLLNKMEIAWGKATDNDIDAIDFNLGLIQALPYYFGSGYMRTSFVQVNKPELQQKWVTQDEINYFEALQPKLAARNAKISAFQMNGELPPFRLMGQGSSNINFKVTNFFLLNPNFRVAPGGALKIDSDGDGLFDEDENIKGTNPQLARSFGYCLDSFYTHEAYASRCKQFETLRSCSPNLDSDGDSLNECEESLLGSNPFDFDTDGDTIPDSLEWIYGYNPVFNDDGVDSNSDGYLNLVQFSAGLGPQHTFMSIAEAKKMAVEVNYQGKEKYYDENTKAKTWVELYQLIFKHAPLKAVLPVDEVAQGKLYASRVQVGSEAAEKNEIPVAEQLIAYNSKSKQNTILVLARMVDMDDPSRVYWRFQRLPVPVTDVISQPELDLSQLKQIRAIDRGQ